jgi:hypothetical protein
MILMNRRLFISALATALGAEASSRADDLVDESGHPLPQTDEQPSVQSDRFRAKIEALSQAIARDEPDLAHGVFFPVVAYQMVKAIEKPERDWKLRLWANFVRDIHDYHHRLGTDGGEARLAGIDVPLDRARWMKPGSEGNKIGYYRVLRSQLRLASPSGRERTFEVTSMISWRGEWYVVHLNGFR